MAKDRHMARRQHLEHGFTLVELMVVVLIISVLIAIATPTYLGARRRAEDRAALSSLRNGYAIAKSIFTDSETYAAATTLRLRAEEPALQFIASNVDSLTSSELSVQGGIGQSLRFVAAAMSKGRRCWYLQDQLDPAAPNPGTRWALDDQPIGGICNADNAPPVGAPSWSIQAGAALDFA